MALYYRNLECTSLKVPISFHCRGFRVVPFVLNGKISNTAKEIVHLVRVKLHIDPEEEGSKMVENAILLPFFHSMIAGRMFCECVLP
jgi:gamma-glutamyl-gamma-aminobutyrate hydrolase PuuD